MKLSVGNPGHAGIAIGNNFYDFGPIPLDAGAPTGTGGDHWAKDFKKLHKLIDAMKSHEHEPNRDVVAVQYCNCTSEQIERRMLDLRNNPREYSEFNLHCTSAVLRAMGGVSFDLPLVSSGVTPDMLFFWSGFYKNCCGADKGKNQNVQIVSKRDINKDIPKQLPE